MALPFMAAGTLATALIIYVRAHALHIAGSAAMAAATAYFAPAMSMRRSRPHSMPGQGRQPVTLFVISSGAMSDPGRPSLRHVGDRAHRDRWARAAVHGPAYV
jgi:hypothetical protein